MKTAKNQQVYLQIQKDCIMNLKSLNILTYTKGGTHLPGSAFLYAQPTKFPSAAETFNSSTVSFVS